MLKKVLIIKRFLIKIISGTSRRNKRTIKIKIELIIFFNDMINIEEFDSNLLKADKKSYKGIDIYYIG